MTAGDRLLRAGGEAHGFLGGAEQGLRLVDALLLLVFRHGLSCTTPAPACTCIMPSFTSAVRSTMQVSISPSAEK